MEKQLENLLNIHSKTYEGDVYAYLFRDCCLKVGRYRDKSSGSHWAKGLNINDKMQLTFVSNI